MRILGVGDDNALGDMYLRLAAAGHDVRVFVGDPTSADVLQGLLTFTADWRAELPWIRDGEADGIVLFESVGHGAVQDQLRRDGFNVIGGSAVGDALETDRAHGQAVLGQAGLAIAESHELDSFAAGLALVKAKPRRYVLKFCGSGFASTRNYVGQRDDGVDMLGMLSVQRAQWKLDEAPRFLLMEHVRGVEMGVGAFFDGTSFIGPPNLDWEHKRFFPGDIGELTGEMGTLVTYRGGQRFFDATLAKVAPLLRGSGHVGYVNLNTIVNDQGIWPLEFTCRFGYPGFAVLDALHVDRWDRIFKCLLGSSDGQGSPGPTLATYDGYSVGVVLTVPPFPYPDGYERLSKGAPIAFASSMTAAERDHIHLGEAQLKDGQLVASGSIGYLLVVTGRGETALEAQRNAYALVDKVAIPNVRYRNDIASSFIARDHAELVRLGWLA